MIDPQKITKFDRTDAELEEFAIFSVCVAGKNANYIAKAVDYLCKYIQLRTQSGMGPLASLYYFVRYYGIDSLYKELRRYGIGCYVGKARTCYDLSEKLIVQRPDFLRVCSIEALEDIKGIGSKTARFFILHSRPAQRIAALDTHILKYLRSKGIDAPKQTPPKGSRKYKELERLFVALAEVQDKSVAQLDLEVWDAYSRSGLRTGG